MDEHQIECEWIEQDAYLYTANENAVQKIRTEHEAYTKLGIERDLVKDLPIPLGSKLALVMKNQAQFHPLQYL